MYENVQVKFAFKEKKDAFWMCKEEVYKDAYFSPFECVKKWFRNMLIFQLLSYLFNDVLVLWILSNVFV